MTTSMNTGTVVRKNLKARALGTEAGLVSLNATNGSSGSSVGNVLGAMTVRLAHFSAAPAVMVYLYDPPDGVPPGLRLGGTHPAGTQVDLDRGSRQGVGFQIQPHEVRHLRQI